MNRSIGVLVALLTISGCARHVVVERDIGDVDGDKSITSMSDDAWAIESEPSPSGDVDPAAAEIR